MVPFIRLLEKVHGSQGDPEMRRLHVGHKIFLGVPFFKKKESVFILDTLATITAFASLFFPDGNR
jgi:hypothetical protein